MANPKRSNDRRSTVTLAVHGNDLAVLRAEAERTGSPYSKILREYALAYIQLRDEAMAAADGAERKSSLIHIVLNGMEARLAATVDRVHSELCLHRNETQILTALLDSFLMLYLAHTPEIPQELEEGHLVSAYTRYDKVIAQLPKALDGDHARLLTALRRSLEGPADGHDH